MKPADDGLQRRSQPCNQHLKPSRTSVMVRCSSSHSWPFHAISQGIRLLPQLYRPLCRFRSASAGGSFGILAPCSRASRNRGPRSVLRFRCCGRGHSEIRSITQHD